jgi:RNA polymerase primary sigma factor
MSKKYVNYSTDDTVSKYFKEVKKSIILTPSQEVELAKRIKKGDSKATTELVEANLKFVISIAKEYQGQGLPLSYLINEGNYGLIKAAHRFDHKRGFRFISYAVWWIKQSIIQSLNDNARVVRLPANVINKISKLNKEMSTTEQENETEPIYVDMFDQENDLSILNYSKSSSLNKLVGDEGGEIVDLLVSEPLTLDIEDVEVNDKVKDELNKILSVLDEREKMIIESYFGMNTTHEGMTLEAIGDKYDLTKERIRQIKEKEIRKLRHHTQTLQDLMNK